MNSGRSCQVFCYAIGASSQIWVNVHTSNWQDIINEWLLMLMYLSGHCETGKKNFNGAVRSLIFYSKSSIEHNSRSYFYARSTGCLT